MDDEARNIKSLGESETRYHYEGADAKLLESFGNPFWVDAMGKREGGDDERSPYRNRNGVAGSLHIEVPEFTSLCPKTGQPDYATIIVDYTPREFCVESKSLKLYLGSFRNHGEFHETCVARITNDLVELLTPFSIKVVGQFTPRGGIPFWPTATWVHPDVRGPQQAPSQIITPR